MRNVLIVLIGGLLILILGLIFHNPRLITPTREIVNNMKNEANTIRIASIEPSINIEGSKSNGEESSEVVVLPPMLIKGRVKGRAPTGAARIRSAVPAKCEYRKLAGLRLVGASRRVKYCE